MVRSIMEKIIQRSELGESNTDLKTLDWITKTQDNFINGIFYLERLKRIFQTPPVNEIVDDWSPPPSSDDDSDNVPPDDFVHPLEHVRQQYTVVSGKKRPRSEENNETTYRKRTRKTSISTDSKISSIECESSHTVDSGSHVFKSCAEQARRLSKI